LLTNFSLFYDDCDDGGGVGGGCGSEGDDGVGVSKLIYFLSCHKHT
jgi:hypothetical protein